MGDTTITLTGRRPVTVNEDEWPLIADVSGDEWQGGDDPAARQQAIEQGQVDRYSLHARRHADGRVIVYGSYTESRVGSNHDGLDRAGQLLTAETADGNLEEAIAAVGKSLDVPARLVADCIDSLPAEDLP